MEVEAGAVEVVEVIDGDSLVVQTPDGRTEVRLAGVNAPEPAECFHAAARATLIELTESASLRMEVAGTDRFGRSLGHVWAGPTHVNLALVARGAALASPGDGLTPRLLEAEAEAASSSRGLWAPTACGAPSSGAIRLLPERSTVDPPGPDDPAMETIAIRNDGDDVVALGGWSLRDGSSRHRYRFADDQRLEPGGTLVIRSADRGWHPGEGPVWNNEGDIALVIDPSGNIVDWWRYRG